MNFWSWPNFDLLNLHEIIRIYYEFVDRVDNSVSRVTVWPHEALLTYEGCPSKSWTFVIKRDCVPGI